MATEIKRMAQLVDTAAGWSSANPILNAGEIAIESDTRRFKVGDGAKVYNNLDYYPALKFEENLEFLGSSGAYKVVWRDSTDVNSSFVFGPLEIDDDQLYVRGVVGAQTSTIMRFNRNTNIVDFFEPPVYQDSGTPRAFNIEDQDFITAGVLGMRNHIYMNQAPSSGVRRIYWLDSASNNQFRMSPGGTAPGDSFYIAAHDGTNWNNAIQFYQTGGTNFPSDVGVTFQGPIGMRNDLIMNPAPSSGTHRIIWEDNTGQQAMRIGPAGTAPNSQFQIWVWDNTQWVSAMNINYLGKVSFIGNEGVSIQDGLNMDNRNSVSPITWTDSNQDNIFRIGTSNQSATADLNFSSWNGAAYVPAITIEPGGFVRFPDTEGTITEGKSYHQGSIEFLTSTGAHKIVWRDSGDTNTMFVFGTIATDDDELYIRGVNGAETNTLVKFNRLTQQTSFIDNTPIVNKDGTEVKFLVDDEDFTYKSDRVTFENNGAKEAQVSFSLGSGADPANDNVGLRWEDNATAGLSSPVLFNLRAKGSTGNLELIYTKRSTGELGGLVFQVFQESGRVDFKQVKPSVEGIPIDLVGFGCEIKVSAGNVPTFSRATNIQSVTSTANPGEYVITLAQDTVLGGNVIQSAIPMMHFVPGPDAGDSIKNAYIKSATTDTITLQVFQATIDGTGSNTFLTKTFINLEPDEVLFVKGTI